MDKRACRQRVATVAGQARTGRRMVHHPAVRVDAARAGARVAALVVDAGAGAVTVRVGNALGPAARVRVARVLRQARARPGAVALAANRVGAARRRVARLAGALGGHDHCKERTRVTMCIKQGKNKHDDGESI